ncbi:MAG TPA: acetylxylan esterase [Candidatus Binatia bacterium]|nr:acetylxylan esterase [Candidatus Binatia bacterium]
MKAIGTAIVFAIWLIALPVRATNYDEARVGAFTLPDPLVLADGRAVTNAEEWFHLRRPEILRLYQEYIYGRSPQSATNVTFNVWDVCTNALGGRAIRKQMEINFSGTPAGPVAHLLLYTPAGARKPVPTFLCLQFHGNYTVIDDPGIAIFPVWNWKTGMRKMPENPVRGQFSHNWEILKTLARGYGIAIIDYNEIEPDLPHDAGERYGVRRNFSLSGPGDWGAISAWAWGASRALDYLETDPDVNGQRVILFGHSRLGKTVLWAAAQDTRFAGVIANCSGEMGAALARRNYGETVDDIIRHFPYWMCGNFKQYAGHRDKLPVDSHFLLSLIAPRPLFLNTGSEDRWGDPHGEFLAAHAASPVYALLGKTGINETNFPPPDRVIGHDITFARHTGKHDVLPEDWDHFLDFADSHFPQNN